MSIKYKNYFKKKILKIVLKYFKFLNRLYFIIHRKTTLKNWFLKLFF